MKHTRSSRQTRNNRSRQSSYHAERSRPNRREILRFEQARGKTVEFVDLDMNFDFPCVEIGFQDKTALHLLLGIAGFTAEPQYSVWKDGNQRILKSWPEVKSDR